MNRRELSEAFEKLLPALFGILSRIAKNDAWAEEALLEVFLSLHHNRLLKQSNPLTTAPALTVVFNCVANTLSAHLLQEEIEARIEEERKRMLDFLRRQRGEN